MTKKLLRQWKKVFLSDLTYVAFELKEAIDKPALILINGDMGVGKTAFVKKFLGDETATSPTYSVINETLDMVYADFYRLESKEEITALELSLYLERKNFILVEWGEKYVHSLIREIPEEFNVYSLEIQFNRENAPQDTPARDFTLYTLKVE